MPTVLPLWRRVKASQREAALSGCYPERRRVTVKTGDGTSADECINTDNVEGVGVVGRKRFRARRGRRSRLSGTFLVVVLVILAGAAGVFVTVLVAMPVVVGRGLRVDVRTKLVSGGVLSGVRVPDDGR